MQLIAHCLFTVKDLEFLSEESKNTEGNRSIKDELYMLTTKETLEDLTKEDIKNDGEADYRFLMSKLYEAIEEVHNVSNALEKIVYIKNILNIGKKETFGPIMAVPLEKNTVFAIDVLVDKDKKDSE